MELEFHVKFLTLLDFHKIMFFIETRFSKNRVSKQGHFTRQFQNMSIFATSFGQKGQMPILTLFPQYISCFILLLSTFYSFSSMSTCFLPCFIALMMLVQPSWARICLNTMFVLRSICLGAPCYVCAQIYMSRCFLACLCLALHIYALLSMSMLRSTF